MKKEHIDISEHIAAVLPLCNFGGIALLDDIDGENVTSVFHDGDKYSDARRTRIHYDARSDRAYITRYRIKYYIDEFMRV